MDTERDVPRIVQSWLHMDEHESADRVLDNVLALLDATPQRRSWWPAQRSTPLNAFAKLATVAAAVAAIALIAILAIPRGGGSVGGPTATSSLTPSSLPSPSPTSPTSPTPSTAAVVFPPTGPLAIGRQSMTRGGIRLSVDVPTAGWSSDQGYFIGTDFEAKSEYVSFLFWNPSPNGVYVDSCGHKAGPVVGPSIADLAAAVSKMPDITLVSGPSDVTVGGHAAKLVVVKVPPDAACAAVAEGFDLWYGNMANGEVRYASAPGVTLRIWVIDVNGTRLFIEAETQKEAGPKVGQTVQTMVDSIQFE